MAVAVFVVLGALTGLAVVLTRERIAKTHPGLYGHTALLALALTTVVAVATHFAVHMLWVGEGQVGVPAAGPVIFACFGFFPAFISGLLLYPMLSRASASEGHGSLALVGGLLLAASLALLAVVSAQAVVEMRTELSRGLFLALLFGSQTLLLAAPALGLATVAWHLRAQLASE